jgi:sarcosine oxidase subunit beta
MKGNAINSVETSKGTIDCGKVGFAVAGSTGHLASKLGMKLPIESHVLQAFVSEPLKPIIDNVVTFGAGHFYISQSDKGGLVFGGDIDMYNSYAQKGNLPLIEDVVTAGLAMIPGLSRLRIVRHWGGVMDMSMDGSPIIGKSPIDNLYLNCGWCYGGFKATPGSGWVFAHTIANDAPHELNAGLNFDRFRQGRSVDENGGGPVPNRH